jgi:hypothetical protein
MKGEIVVKSDLEDRHRPMLELQYNSTHYLKINGPMHFKVMKDDGLSTKAEVLQTP